MYQPTGPINKPITKGTRQPQLCNASSDSSVVSAQPDNAPSSAAAPWLAPCQQTMKQRLSVRPDSIKNAEAAPTSPPAENPWSRRPKTNSPVATMPMLE